MDMTRDLAIAKLKELQGPGDTEAQHGIADTILCELLRLLGYGDVVDEYEKIDKWYA